MFVQPIVVAGQQQIQQNQAQIAQLELMEIVNIQVAQEPFVKLLQLLKYATIGLL